MIREHVMRRCLTGLLPALLVSTSGLYAAPAVASASTQEASSASGVLTISNASGSLYTCGFSPYNPNTDSYSAGFIYEPLMFVDTLNNDKTTPWLATSYSWSDANKVLTFTIRKGVRWSDGQPLTPADVVFTFNLLKKFPALDLNDIWSVLNSVTQQGDNVILTFKTAAVPYFFYVADKVFVLPQHIWGSVQNPVSYADSSPIGTGPYLMSKCTPENITYTANASYWQPGLPKVKTLEYPAFTSNEPANEELANGQAQLGAQGIPNVKALYTSKNPNYRYWFPPVSLVNIYINLKVPSLDQLAVREAMAYAIDRKRVSEIGMYGNEPPANQAGIVTPTFTSWLDKSLSSRYGTYNYDPKKAVAILENAGYRRGSNGIFAKNGKELSFTLDNNAGFTLWVGAAQVAISELAAVGIKVTPDNLAGSTYNAAIVNGHYQLAWGSSQGGTPSPYYMLRELLYSGDSAPIGQPASSNWERYFNPRVDALINKYASTTSVAEQHGIVNQLQSVMLSDVPVIPITEGVDWFEYDSGAFSGWPTPGNPYAQPAIYVFPDNEVVLLHLKTR